MEAFVHRGARSGLYPSQQTADEIIDSADDKLLWTPAQRSLSEVHYTLPVFIYIFYGRLILWPKLTEVRETFTRGGP